ncbi:aldo/keto reductase [Aeromonas hydrophila]|uniref:aldo/keto reductase n=1 Tax=Aeromonas hydrophila TaxID=644 RepID=UPI0007609624|nr:aldo/keto reductase [Aeromonas hydrophila]EHK5437915.1 aldo/keto reductase [Aeromonas hydrophila]KWR68440.1 aldo/keto reductase [Aeromonas hydrophila]HAU4930391.1 aldo/keto reductase [Aeromonas hydrophila]
MRLALGTVQFGLDYGISNHDGQVCDEELDKIIALARHAGIDTLDTAQAYGNAEQRLGQIDITGFTLIDKLAPGLPLSDVKAAINNSLHLLGRKRLDGLLLHRSQDASPALFELLTDLQQQGSIGKLGISVYSPEELDTWSAAGYPLELVQLPANLLDQRFLRTGWLDKLVDMGCEIHVRSLFLQGLLLMQPAQRPDYFQRFATALERFDHWHPSIAPLGRALSIMTALPQVSRFVVGVCHAQELDAIVAASQAQYECYEADIAHLASMEQELINPGLWRTR